jgi:hypothetical protein
VVLLDKWEELDVEYLDASYATYDWSNYDKLFEIPYWIDM